MPLWGSWLSESATTNETKNDRGCLNVTLVNHAEKGVRILFFLSVIRSTFLTVTQTL